MRKKTNPLTGQEKEKAEELLRHRANSKVKGKINNHSEKEREWAVQISLHYKLPTNPPTLVWIVR